MQITQQAMWKLEQKEQIEDELLEKISKILNVPVESIKILMIYQSYNAPQKPTVVEREK